MSTPEQQAEHLAQQRAPAHRPRTLHQPWRVLVAALELLVAAALVLLAVWLWRTGVVRIVFPDGAVAMRYLGNWISGAIGLCVLAGFLLLDCCRELALGIRTRSRRTPDPEYLDDVV